MPSPTTVLLRTQSDERLVALARGGHDRAFEAIVERYRRQLLRACRRILPEARAEDALQQALMGAWAALRRGDEVVELRPWLFRIVRNTALNQLRVTGYDLGELVETLGSAEDPEDEVARREVVRQTLAAVAALPERQREALLRTAIDGQAQADAARDLGLTNTAMRQLVHRARVSVRAAATALVPMPVATWLASAGGATATATLAKAGTVAVLAGGAVTAPTLIHHDRPPAPRQRAETRSDEPRERPRAVAATPTATAAPVLAVATVAPQPVETTREPQVREHNAVSHRRDDDRDDDDRGDRGDARDHHRGNRDDDRPRGEDRDDSDDGHEGDDGHGSGSSRGSDDGEHEFDEPSPELDQPPAGDAPEPSPSGDDEVDSSGHGSGGSDDGHEHDD